MSSVATAIITLVVYLGLVAIFDWAAERRQRKAADGGEGVGP